MIATIRTGAAALFVLTQLVLVASCGDDPSAPDGDSEPPNVEILDAPTSVSRGDAVEISFRATDDTRLSTVSIAWGTIDAPVEIRFPTGRAYESTASYTYADPGTYRVTVSASDERGRSASDFVMTTVEP